MGLALTGRIGKLVWWPQGHTHVVGFLYFFMELLFILILFSWFWESYNSVVKTAPSKWVSEEEFGSDQRQNQESNLVYAESSQSAKIFATLIRMGATAIGVTGVLVAIAVPIGILVVVASYIFGF